MPGTRRVLRGLSRHPRYRLLYDRQIDQRGEYTERDRQRPDRIVRTGALEHNAAESDAEETAVRAGREMIVIEAARPRPRSAGCPDSPS
jgi:hypothetical protein